VEEAEAEAEIEAEAGSKKEQNRSRGAPLRKGAPFLLRLGSLGWRRADKRIGVG
jgi:hypothetical protein